MQLTMYTDYSLRTLIFLGLAGEKPVTIGEIADFYKISRNHLVKVVHNLSKTGFIISTRGKGGGIRLAMPAKNIVIADVVHQTEPNFHLVECLNETSQQTCTVIPVCALKNVLIEAMEQFNKVLENYTLEDVIIKSRNASGPSHEILQFFERR